MKNIISMALSPTTATANQRASWLPGSDAAGRDQLQDGEDEGDPPPGAQVAD